MKTIRFGDGIPPGFFWYNEPEFTVSADGITLVTRPWTDFWQRTHYGFRRDNGHCLLTYLDYDFSITLRTHFECGGQYDQCGLVVRADAENWIKVSMEYETPELSRLGSVVTSGGFSDWATQDVSKPVHDMWYRVQRTADDYLLEAAFADAGEKAGAPSWFQLRIAHLHTAETPITAGIYACSPENSSFEAHFRDLSIEQSGWFSEIAISV